MHCAFFVAHMAALRFSRSQQSPNEQGREASKPGSDINKQARSAKPDAPDPWDRFFFVSPNDAILILGIDSSSSFRRCDINLGAGFSDRFLLLLAAIMLKIWY
jgi:hypothetical protein